MIRNLLQRQAIYAPVYMRENGTVQFGTEPLRTSHLNAKCFQMIPGVVPVEEEYVVNYRKPVLFRIWCVQ